MSRSYSIWPHTQDLAAGIRGEDMQPGPAAFGQHTQRRAGVHLLAAKLGMAGMGRVEHFVKAAHQRVFRACHPVGENAEHFLRQYALVDAVMVIQRSLRAPADVHRAVHVRFAVFKNGAKLGPVIYFLVGQHFHGRAGNDHAVEALVFDLVEGFVKRLQMRSGHMRALVGIHVQQRQLHLQGLLASMRAICVSVAIFVGIRFTSRMRSGRMSCVMARARCMTNTFSSSSAL